MAERGRPAAPVMGDLGSALLSGALHVTAGAPSPPVLHPDPMMEFYKGLCSDDIISNKLYMSNK